MPPLGAPRPQYEVSPQITVPVSARVVAEPVPVAEPAALVTVSVHGYARPGHRLPAVSVVQLPLAWPPPDTARVQVGGLPPSWTVKLTVIASSAADEPVTDSLGTSIVRAVFVTAGPSPAALTAETLICTVAPSAKPVSVRPVPFTS